MSLHHKIIRGVGGAAVLVMCLTLPGVLGAQGDTEQVQATSEEAQGGIEGEAQAYSDQEVIPRGIGVTVDMVIGDYQHNPVQNDWHMGSITKDGAGLHWTNKAGVSWRLTPDLANQQLLTGTDNPYYAQGLKEFKLIISNNQITAFTFAGGTYQRTSPQPQAQAPVQAPVLGPITAAMLPGAYQQNPVQNDWHIGQIEQDAAGQFWWKNKAGVQWRLTPDPANLRLLATGSDNPYAAQGERESNRTLREFNLIISNGYFTGFTFAGGTYKRDVPVATLLLAQPDAPNMGSNLLRDGGFELGLTKGPGTQHSAAQYGRWVSINNRPPTACNGKSTSLMGMPNTQAGIPTFEGKEAMHIGNCKLMGGVAQLFQTIPGWTYRISLQAINNQGLGEGFGLIRVRYPSEQTAPSSIAKTYTIQQKVNGRFLDAHENGSDFSAVTRPAQAGDASQQWILTPVGPNTYTIQQKGNERFLDAHENGSDFSAVTRPAQAGDASQQWILTPVGPNTFTIQQKGNGRFLDAHEKGYDFSAVTRPAQRDASQQWILTIVDTHTFTAGEKGWTLFSGNFTATGSNAQLDIFNMAGALTIDAVSIEAHPGQQLLRNGGFELGMTDGANPYISPNGKYGAWTVTRPSQENCPFPALYKLPYETIPKLEGQEALALGWCAERVWQSVPTTPGSKYTISFTAINGPERPRSKSLGTARIRVFNTQNPDDENTNVGIDLLGDKMVAARGNGPWFPYSSQFTATGPSTTVEFTPISGSRLFMDNVQINEVKVDELAKRFAPVLSFDRAASPYGYPMSTQDFYTRIDTNVPPQEGNFRHPTMIPGGKISNTNQASLKDGSIPTYYQVRFVGPKAQVRILYWWFYGFQEACMGEYAGSHNGDWERVMVTLKEDRSGIAAVTFWQHNNFYTRTAGRKGICSPDGIGRCRGPRGFQTVGDGRPRVFVGKIAHGSYHNDNANGPGGCGYHADFRNPKSPADDLDTQLNLVDLDGNSQLWMVNDESNTFRWGPSLKNAGGTFTIGGENASGGHPKKYFYQPKHPMPACAGNATYTAKSSGCFKSECLAYDDEEAGSCSAYCPPGYTNMGLWCGKGASMKSTINYDYDYTIPTDDVGLVKKGQWYKK